MINYCQETIIIHNRKYYAGHKFPLSFETFSNELNIEYGYKCWKLVPYSKIIPKFRGNIFTIVPRSAKNNIIVEILSEQDELYIRNII